MNKRDGSPEKIFRKSKIIRRTLQKTMREHQTTWWGKIKVIKSGQQKYEEISEELLKDEEKLKLDSRS